MNSPKSGPPTTPKMDNVNCRTRLPRCSAKYATAMDISPNPSAGIINIEIKRHVDTHYYN